MEEENKEQAQPIAICDNPECKAEFVPETKEEPIECNISKVFFSCPECGKEYIIHYNGKLVEIKQNQVLETVKKFEEAQGVDPLKAERLFKQYQKQKKEVGKAMDQLEKKVATLKEDSEPC